MTISNLKDDDRESESKEKLVDQPGGARIHYTLQLSDILLNQKVKNDDFESDHWQDSNV